MSDFLYLSAADVERVRPAVAEVLAATEAALRAHAEGAIENPPKIGVHTRPHAFTHAMPGWLRPQGLTGVKCVAGYPDNAARGLPHVFGLLLLQDPDTGLPYALMECSWVTAARTAAATALFVRECALPAADALGLLGAGAQAREIVPAVACARPAVRRVVVYDPSRAAIEQFRAEVPRRCPVEVVVAADARQVVGSADIVVGAAGPVSEPLTRNDWFRPGALLVAVGYGLDGEALHGADRVVTTDARQMAATAAELLGLPPGGGEGGASGVRVDAELGAVLAGRVPGRTSAAERVFAYNSGLAIFDLAVGDLVVRAARAAGVGRRLPLF